MKLCAGMTQDTCSLDRKATETAVCFMHRQEHLAACAKPAKREGRMCTCGFSSGKAALHGLHGMLNRHYTVYISCSAMTA